MGEPAVAIKDDEALRLVAEGTVSETGTEFFRALVRNLAAVMGTTGAWVKELEARPAGQRQLCIPQSFTVLRWDKSTFPAEATLSRFENRGQVFHTLILRNVDDRVEAARRIESLTVQTEYLQAEIRALQNFDEIIGQSAALRQVLRDVEQVAVTDATVLIQGETGTGKELFFVPFTKLDHSTITLS